MLFVTEHPKFDIYELQMKRQQSEGMKIVALSLFSIISRFNNLSFIIVIYYPLLNSD
jgi:hypothetical protein